MFYNVPVKLFFTEKMTPPKPHVTKVGDSCIIEHSRVASKRNKQHQCAESHRIEIGSRVNAMISSRSPDDSLIQPLLLKEKEAAMMLNFSPRLLWSLSNQGLVPFIRLGGAKRYSPEDLKAFIQSEREKGPKKR
jgi:hypothetical protein